MKPLIPPDEAARLEALRQYDVLDTAPEQEFDDLTHIAALVCGTPMSAMILIDQERQWFKSRVGLAAHETPRDISFCAHAILSHDLLLVPDAEADDRFADDPLVTDEPHLRFYAGVPLVTPEGYAVGSLCVLDTVPRQLDSMQQDLLKRLARQAVALLEARPDASTQSSAEKGRSRQARQRAERQQRTLAAEAAQRDTDSLKFSEMRYRRLFEAAKDGILILDAESGRIEDVNPYLCQLLGYERDDFIGSQLWEIGTFHDIAANQDAFRNLQEQEYIRYDDLPLKTKAGPIASVEFVSNVYESADKKVIQCNIRDISARKNAMAAAQESQRFLQATLDALSSHIAVLDEHGNLVAVNKAWQRFAAENQGTAASCGVGANYIQVCDQSNGPWAEEAPLLARGIREVMAGQHGAFCLEYPCHSPQQQRWFNVCVTRFVGDGPVRVVVSHENITERKQAEAALRHSEQRYRSLALATTQIVWTTPADGMVQDMPAWRNYTGQTQAEVRGWGWMQALHPDDLEPTRNIWRRCVEAKSDYETEYRIRDAQGNYRLFAVHGVPILESDGSIREWVGTCADIQDRRMAEEERDRFFTMSLDMLGTAGFDGYFKRLNPAFSETLGFSEAELLTRPFLEFVYPEDRAMTQAALAGLSNSGMLVGFENRYLSKDGSLRWLEWKAVAAEGVVYAAARDVTKRKEAKATLLRANDELELRVGERTIELHAANALLQSEVVERKAALDALHQAAAAIRATQDMLQLVINHIPQAIFWKDRQFSYLGCNNRMALDAGYDSPTEILGKTDFEMPWAEQADAYRADDAQVMDTDTPKLNIVEVLTTADGSKIWLRTNKVPLHDSEGNVVGVLASYEDITQQKAAEAAIHQAREEAEAANHAKSEFLSRMSHELRTPLNAILGFSQILEMRVTDARQLGNIQQILKAGRHLLGLINEVLDITRIEAGHLSLSLEPIPASIVVREALDLVRPLATARNIQLQNEVVGENADRHLLADQQRFKQVLLNLVSNAVKYNREGGAVFVGCEVILSAPVLLDGVQHEGHARILVRDTGKGLSAPDIAKLFVPFERLEAARSQIEGTGIGLTLCKRLVEAMDGRIGVESVVGEGSTFWVELPLVKSALELAAPPLSAAEDVSAHAATPVLGTILYIEDNLSNINLIEQALSDQDYQVRFLTAMQGSVGLELAAQHAPDLILLDVHLPDIMGDVVLRHLKAGATTRDIPVVVLSADATPSQIERLLSGGAEAYLTKPLDLRQFFAVLEEILKRPHK